MKIKIFALFFILSASTLSTYPQINIKGFVYEQDSIPVADVSVNVLPANKTFITNQSGQFHFQISTPDTVAIQVLVLGYDTVFVKKYINRNQNIVLRIKKVDKKIAPVLVFAKKQNPNTISIDIEQARKLPMIGGKTDILKISMFTPGVQMGQEGNAGIYVRGGSADQNLFLINGVPTYNVNHIGGFVSQYNVEAISESNIIKDGFPAKYGGKLSSVFEIKT